MARSRLAERQAFLTSGQTIDKDISTAQLAASCGESASVLWGIDDCAMPLPTLDPSGWGGSSLMPWTAISTLRSQAPSLPKHLDQAWFGSHSKCRETAGLPCPQLQPARCAASSKAQIPGCLWAQQCLKQFKITAPKHLQHAAERLTVLMCK